MLVYDGDCGFCTTSAHWVERHAGPDLRVAPSQRLSDGDLEAAGLTRADVETAAYWVNDVQTLRGHRAIAAALKHIGGPWGIVGRVIDAPALSPLSSGAYDLVARYRHRLPGGTATCRLDARVDAGPGSARVG